MTSEEILKQVSFRPMQIADEPFIYSSWLKSFFMSSDFCKNISKTDFFSNHHQVIEKILGRQSVDVIVAHAIDEPGLILAYLVYDIRADERSILHYVYVKEAFRGDGIAKHLINSISTVAQRLAVSHLTNSLCMQYLSSKYNLNYNPYLM